jgi:hypothetical protein
MADFIPEIYGLKWGTSTYRPSVAIEDEALRELTENLRLITAGESGSSTRFPQTQTKAE